MSNRIPPLNSLRVFEVAARLKSFKKAAEELHVTPAAVSHQVIQLENFLGVQLFRRVNQGIELTTAAIQCLPQMQDGMRNLRESIDRIQSYPHVNTITVTSSPSFAMKWLMPRIHRFMIAHPEIDVQVSTKLGPFSGRRGTRNADMNVESWAAEADVVLMLGSTFNTDLKVTKLLSPELTALCSPSFLEGTYPLQKLADIKHHKLIHDDRGALYAHKPFWTLWSEAAELTDLDTERGPRFTHALIALSAAVEGLGIVVSTPVLAQEDIASGRLVAPFPHITVPIDSSYFIVSNELTYRRDDVAAFRQWLLDEAQTDALNGYMLSEASLSSSI